MVSLVKRLPSQNIHSFYIFHRMKWCIVVFYILNSWELYYAAAHYAMSLILEITWHNVLLHKLI